MIARFMFFYKPGVTLTLQGKPNTHDWGTDGSPRATFPLSSRVMDQGHPPQVHGPTDYGRRWVMLARALARDKFKRYNSKIVSAGKDWREEVLKLDQFYLGFVLQSIWL